MVDTLGTPAETAGIDPSIVSTVEETSALTPGTLAPEAGTLQHDRLSDDHPLVKTLGAQKAEIKNLQERIAATTQEHANQIAQLTNERDTAILTGTRHRVAAEYGIPASRADLLLTGVNEETLVAQAKELANIPTTIPKSGSYSEKSAPTQEQSLNDFLAAERARRA
jgi:hypothetical protein